MTKSFIHGVWGVYENKNKWWTRREKIDNDIKLAFLNPYSPPSKVYVFGEENAKKIADAGFNVTMVDKKPYVFDMEKEQYRHKIEVWKAGLQEFDEIVFIDWDCVPVRKLPDDFWDVMSKGEKVQATIYMYVLQRVFFRNNDSRKVSASTFTYLRGKETVDNIIRVWEEIGRPWQEEIALSKYIDELNKGWHGIEGYKKFEPKYHCLFWHYDKEFLRQKYLIFFHYNKHVVKNILGDGDVKGITDRLNDYCSRELTRFEKSLVIPPNFSAN